MTDREQALAALDALNESFSRLCSGDADCDLPHDAVDTLRAYLAREAPPTPDMVFGWLIETTYGNSQVAWYWTGREWTPDAYAAVRFAAPIDGEDEYRKAHKSRKNHSPVEWREHGFSASPGLGTPPSAERRLLRLIGNLAHIEGDLHDPEICWRCAAEGALEIVRNAEERAG